MLDSSHITNFSSSAKVRTSYADTETIFPHKRSMARRGIPKGPVNWYLREWMAACGVKKQTEMMAKTGWSKATMSQLYNGQQDYSPKVVNEAAQALSVHPWELLMPPEQAKALQQLRQDALRVVETSKVIDAAKDRTGTDG